MEKEFVPYELAVKLKALGFDEYVFEWFNSETKDFCDVMKEVKAPTFSQAFRWFRDNFGLSGWVDESFTTNNRQGVVSVKSPKGLEYIQSPKSTMFFETYEEAELTCLTKLIEIVEQAKN